MRTEREKKLGTIWRFTHRDFKGVAEDGTKMVLLFVPGTGTCSVPLETLTDEQIEAKLPKARVA